MIESPGILLTLLAFLLVIGPLVIVHELGHYLAGRWFGVKADEFSIGFGRELFGWDDRRGTRWQVRMLPLGGYVRFAGDMNAASQPSPEWLALPAKERGQTFQAKPLWQRAIIVAAGPVTNFVVAILILAAFALAFGAARTPPVIEGVVAGGPAATAGLKAGDRITAIGGRTVDTFEDIVDFVAIRPGEQVRVDLERAGTPQSLQMTIRRAREQDRFGNISEIGRIGVPWPRPVRERVSVVEAPLIGIEGAARVTRVTIEGLGQIITGRRPLDELGGPLKIAQISGQQLALGPTEFVFLIALISINLGFINLLPVPTLDGGHLLFYAIEAIRRRPLGPNAQEWAFRGGLAAIVALMLFVTINDLGALGVWNNLAGLIG